MNSSKYIDIANNIETIQNRVYKNTNFFFFFLKKKKKRNTNFLFIFQNIDVCVSIYVFLNIHQIELKCSSKLNSSKHIDFANKYNSFNLNFEKNFNFNLP